MFLTGRTLLRHVFVEGMIMEFLSDFWLYLKERKKFWLVPILVIFALFGGLIVLTNGTAVAPFIYTLF
jgi:hypothetical protein